MALLNLPTEILLNIAQTLCPHCSSNATPADHLPPGSEIKLHSSRDASKALSRLSRTCKTLRDLTQPVLFHWAVAQPGKFLFLARAIIQRPELASMVRELHCDYRVAQQRSKAGWHALLEEVADYDAIKRITNVERLVIETDKELPHDGFSLLQRLADLTLIYLDPAGGEISAVDGIISVAPALRVLRGYNLFCLDGIPKHCESHVREVHLSMCAIEADSYKGMMHQLCNLSSFSCESGYKDLWHGYEATPWELSRALLLRRDSLQKLSVNFQFYCNHHLGQTDTIRSLKEMQVLETLAVDSRSLVGDSDDESTNGTLLTELLPASIKSFTLADPYSGVEKDLLGLAEEAPQMFPSLRGVYVTYSTGFIGQRLRLNKDLEHAFAARGIELCQVKALV